MGQTPDQIESEIDRAREHLRWNLRELEARAREATDWRSQFRKHPGVMLAAAALAGAWLAAMLGRRR